MQLNMKFTWFAVPVVIKSKITYGEHLANTSEQDREVDKKTTTFRKWQMANIWNACVLWEY